MSAAPAGRDSLRAGSPRSISRPQRYRYFKTLRLEVAGGYLALAGLHAGFHDRQAQPAAAGLPGPVGLYPVKRVKQVGQLAFRHARPAIGYGQMDPAPIAAAVTPGGNSDLTGAAGITDGVSHHVSHSTDQQVRLGRSGQVIIYI